MDPLLLAEMDSLRAENGMLKQRLDDTRRRLQKVMELLDTPLWKVLAPDLFSPVDRHGMAEDRKAMLRGG